MQFLYYIGWFLIWFLVLSFAVVPLEPIVREFGALPYGVFMGLVGGVLLYGFIFIRNITKNKRSTTAQNANATSGSEKDHLE